jgi:predicted Rossmann-fold nucleotide-binding protein
LHTKPCILINTAGYWDRLLSFLDSTVAAGFLNAENRRLLLVASSAADAISLAAGKQE